MISDPAVQRLSGHVELLAHSQVWQRAGVDERANEIRRRCVGADFVQIRNSPCNVEQATWLGYLGYASRFVVLSVHLPAKQKPVSRVHAVL